MEKNYNFLNQKNTHQTINNKDILNKSFQKITKNIKNMITNTQLEIMINANKKLINLYYNIDIIISDNYKWENKFVNSLALELKLSFPNLKGFSVRNLNYMKAFYEEYKNDNEFLQLVAKLPWTHNIKLIQKINK